MVVRAKHAIESSAKLRSCNSHQPEHERRLALEVRSRRFGFAFFEDANLLDWGARTYSEPKTAARKVHSLITLYAPAVVVARRTHRLRRSATQAMQEIRLELKGNNVKSVILSGKQIVNFFAGCGCHNKHQIASRIAGQFPMLKWILPKPRRPWNPEAHAMVVFDAVATDVAFNGILPDPNPEF